MIRIVPKIKPTVYYMLVNVTRLENGHITLIYLNNRQLHSEDFVSDIELNDKYSFVCV
jgi:hypothetical protein